MSIKAVFLSVPLIATSHNDTESHKLRGFFEELAKTCEKHDLEVYRPYEHSDPLEHSYLADSDVYNRNRSKILQCDIVIAYVGIVSAGVAIEIEIAYEANIPVLLLYDQQHSKGISRMILGCPAVKAVETAQDITSLQKQLDEKLADIIRSFLDYIPNQRNRAFAEVLNVYKQNVDLGLDILQARTGLEKGYISRLMRGQIANPRRDQIIKLCLLGWRLSLEDTNKALIALQYQPI